MATIKLKFVVEDVDRHGNVRIYFRRRGQMKIRLPGVPGSQEFMDAYERALSGTFRRKEAATAAEAKKESLTALCTAYYRASEFQRLDDRTKRVRRNILDDLCRRHGEKPVDRLEPRHVRTLRDEKADRPEAANALVKALRQVFSTGIANNIVKSNPAREVPYLRSGAHGYHSWTPEEIAAFEKRHPIGTRARLAMALLLFTGQRRSDVVAIGKQHVHNGSLCFMQHKNRRNKPVTLEIPIVRELQRIIDESPCGDLTFLVTEFGRPFTSAGFGNRFRQWCDEVGLKTVRRTASAKPLPRS